MSKPNYQNKNISDRPDSLVSVRTCTKIHETAVTVHIAAMLLQND